RRRRGDGDRFDRRRRARDARRASRSGRSAARRVTFVLWRARGSSGVLYGMSLVMRIHATGGPEQLRRDDVEVPSPGRGEVLLRQTAIGVNFIDVYHRTGLYPLPGLPHVLGGEAVGVVAALGPGVRTLRVGDRVGYAGAQPPGAYAELRVMPAARL